MMYFMDGP